MTVIRWFLLWGLSCKTTYMYMWKYPFWHIHMYTNYNWNTYHLVLLHTLKLQEGENAYTRRPCVFTNYTCTKLSCNWDSANDRFHYIWSLRSSRHVKLCYLVIRISIRNLQIVIKPNSISAWLPGLFYHISLLHLQFCSVITLISLVKFTVVIRGIV